ELCMRRTFARRSLRLQSFRSPSADFAAKCPLHGGHSTARRRQPLRSETPSRGGVPQSSRCRAERRRAAAGGFFACRRPLGRADRSAVIAARSGSAAHAAPTVLVVVSTTCLLGIWSRASMPLASFWAANAVLL